MCFVERGNADVLSGLSDSGFLSESEGQDFDLNKKMDQISAGGCFCLVLKST